MELSDQLHTPGALPPGKELLVPIGWIGGWVGSRAVLDAVVKRKIPNPRRESNPRTPIVYPVAQPITDTLWMSYNGLHQRKVCLSMMFRFDPDFIF
jgi:hypothetical protein